MSTENSTHVDQPTTFDPNIHETCSVMQAATRAGVSKRTVYNWMEKNLVEWVATAGGNRRIFVDTIFRAKPQKLGTVVEQGAVVDVD